MNPHFKSSFDMTAEERDAAALSKLDPEVVEEITNKINKLYDKLKALDDKSTSDLFRVSEIVDKWGSDQMLKPELKHTNQQNKIVDWMKDHELLKSKEKSIDQVFIEYGAGRAGLSSYIAQRISGENKPDNEVKFVIVDRDTRRRKLDKNFRDEFQTIREKMDIADFDV